MKEVLPLTVHTTQAEEYVHLRGRLPSQCPGSEGKCVPGPADPQIQIGLWSAITLVWETLPTPCYPEEEGHGW